MSNTTKMSATDRIQALLDDNSFVEIGAMITKRNTDFNLQEESVPGDGVITGYGVIDGRPVYVYSQDASRLGGSIGEMHAKKIAGLYDFAMKTGAPVIGLIDCAGFRLQEAVDALAAFGELYLKQSAASGMIPQISAVFGACGGGSAISAGLSDFTLMSEKDSGLFVNSPNTLDGNHVGKCNTGGARFQAEAGNVDFIGKDEAEVIAKIRQLIGLLPSNCEEEAFYEECTDDLNRLCEGFGATSADPAKALADISDNGFIMEIKKEYAKEMVTAFIRLNGMTVGAVANRTMLLDNTLKAVEKYEARLTTAGCEKARRFVSFCDSFHIPVLTLTQVVGYQATACEEKTIASAAAGLTNAFASATVPKVNVIIGDAFGSAYITMNSRHIGADMVFALPTARIGMMDSLQAARIMYAEEGAAASNAEALLQEKAALYEQIQSSAEAAAKRGYVDGLIEPESVRKHLIYALEMLFTKKEDRPAKKHGTV